MTAREEADRRDRRDLDKRFEKSAEDLKKVVDVQTAELNNIDEQLSKSAVWQASHEAKDEERWKANTEKWEEAGVKFNGLDFKLNAIIGTSFVTLLSICGFFIMIWIDRQDQKEQHRSELPRASAQNNQEEYGP